MQKMLSYVRRAVDHYHMIEDGDRIAVGVSGAFFGAGRLVKAFPRMRHGRRGLPLDALRRQEDKDCGRDDPDGPSASA